MAWDLGSQLLASSTLTASGTGAWVSPEGTLQGDGVTTLTGVRSGVALAQMWVGTVTGTSPTLDMYVEESDDLSAIYEAGKFNCGVPLTAVQIITATKTTTDQYQCVFTRKRTYLRVRWVIGGSASPTFNKVIVNTRALGVQIPDVPSST